MKYLFLHYPKCGTCIKAAKWLRANGIDVEARDITLQNPTAQELSAWIPASGLPIRKFFNTSGLEIQGTEPERKKWKQQPAKSCCPYSPPTASWSNAVVGRRRLRAGRLRRNRMAATAGGTLKTFRLIS